MLEPIKNEHYYAMKLNQLSEDMTFIASLKLKAGHVEHDEIEIMMAAIACCKKKLIKDLEEITQFLS